jgi:catechol 2,3-dioxygenase-like lactoylglutathione lyase family enzyme
MDKGVDHMVNNSTLQARSTRIKRRRQMNAPQNPAPTTASERALVPCKLAHYVIRAKHWDQMLAWYRTVFNLQTSFEAPVIAFLTYDEEHHRIAFLNTAHLPAPDTMRTGVDHVAFTYERLSDLLHNWERLKAKGIEPFWCINHGMSTSMYYRDPDGNEIELQVDNFPTMDECKGWFASAAFAANPIGVDYDPAVLLQKLRSGVPESELLKQGAAPVPEGKRYVFTTLPPPPG